LFDFSPERLLALAILFLTSLPVHEWAHAWVAFQLGDDTAARRGRLTINPLAHLDPIGTITLVLFGYGWGKPVPVATHRLRGNRRASEALVSLAGPLSNLLLAMIAAIPLRMGWLFGTSAMNLSLQETLFSFILINLSLMVFNLIPVPPLDGASVLAWLLPPPLARMLDHLKRFGGVGLFAVLFFLSRLGLFTAIMGPTVGFLLRALLFW